MTRKNTPALAVAAASSVLVAAACGADEDRAAAEAPVAPAVEVCDAAKDEGRVAWYSTKGDNANVPVAEAFEEAFPDIEVDLLRQSSGQLQARYASEREANSRTADVVTMAGSEDWFADAVDQGWFETELDISALEDWPAENYADGLAMLSIGLYGIAYNTDLVASPPQTYEDLLSDEFADGAIVLPDPSRSFSQIAISVVWFDEYGEEYLSEISAQKPQLVDSIVNGIQLVGSGSARIAVGTPLALAISQEAEGAPIGWVEVLPTTGAEYLHGVSTNTAHPNAARCFTDFLLSEAGQAAFNGDGSVSPLSDDLPGVVPMPDGYVSVTPDRASELRDTIYEIYGVRE